VSHRQQTPGARPTILGLPPLGWTSVADDDSATVYAASKRPVDVTWADNAPNAEAVLKSVQLAVRTCTGLPRTKGCAGRASETSRVALLVLVEQAVAPVERGAQGLPARGQVAWATG
jgi:hypothetical protein